MLGNFNFGDFRLPAFGGGNRPLTKRTALCHLAFCPKAPFENRDFAPHYPVRGFFLWGVGFDRRSFLMPQVQAFPVVPTGNTLSKKLETLPVCSSDGVARERQGDDDLVADDLSDRHPS